MPDEAGATEEDLTKLLALALCEPAATEVALADLLSEEMEEEYAGAPLLA